MNGCLWRKRRPVDCLLRYLEGLSAERPEAAGLLAGLQVQHVNVSEQDDRLKLETRVVAHRP